MIKVHHLNNSRSQRILWLLEEMGADYEIVRYTRDKTTNLAPPELRAVHPLGKSPMIEMDGRPEHCTFNLNQKLLPLKQHSAVFERIF